MSDSFLAGFSRPLYFAHRGLSAKAPENTIAAFSLAWEKGVPGVELDVRLCGDGELVVFHDDDLKRITGVSGRVEDRDVEGLQKLDAGDGERIPTLSETLKEAPRDAYFDIEIKVCDGNARQIVNKLAAILDRYDMEGRCMISSFYPSAVRAAKSKQPAVAWIFSSSLAQNQRIKYVAGSVLTNATVLKPQWDTALSMLAKRKPGRKPIIPWTVNDAEIAKRCLDLGCEGIISDDPTAFI